ncbi:Type I phosphodiesterase / nucleotide pyrophosphatase [Plasmodiophora brassicae]|uniref:Uncharacterized protein n=1 Tax=Plasmodiophora brassicae TaxID=37360 RepID=A0A0G4IJM6_PLABS|nr:hypothetical protein PBRA_004048 [Plasmodiophora brassicae]
MGDDDRRAAVDDAAPLLDGVSSRAAPERRSIPVGRALSVVTCGIVAVVVVVLVTLVPGRRGSPPHCLVVVSLDGFRYDYLKHLPPDSALQRLAAEGVHVNRLRPVFPSKTFPNHYTLVTGVFPETHGIVGNHFFDPTDSTWFTMGSTESKWWGAEPIWVTAELQRRQANVFFWPGSSAVIKGVSPTVTFPYNESVTFEERIDRAREWVGQGVQRPPLIMVYLSEPDASGHEYGPDSEQTISAIHRADSMISRLIDGLDRTNVDLLIVSDHGMVNIGDSPDKIIDLDKFLHVPIPNRLRVAACTPELQIYPDADLIPEIVQNLSAAVKQYPNIKVYRKEEIPRRFQYRDNARIAPFVVVADVGYKIVGKSFGCPDDGLRGGHGFDNDDPRMGGILIGVGPSFEERKQVPILNNTEVYETMCRILEIVPAPNNGTRSGIDSLLKHT